MQNRLADFVFPCSRTFSELMISTALILLSVVADRQQDQWWSGATLPVLKNRPKAGIFTRTRA